MCPAYFIYLERLPKRKERKRKRERKRGKEVEVQNEKRRGKKVSFFFRSGEIPLSKGDPPSFLVDARREPRALARRRRRGGHRKLRREKKNKRELTFLGRRRSSVRSLSRFRSFAPLPTTRGFGITLAPSLADVFGVQIAPAELYFTPEIKATEGEEPTGSEMARWALASCCCDAELPRAPAPPPASASLSPPPPPVTRRASAAFISILKKRSSLGAEKKEVSEGGPRASEKRLRRSPHVIEKREFSVARIQRFDGRKRTRKRKKPSRFSPRQDFFSQSTPGFKLFATES
jgi:hypothetical protein